MARWFEGPNTSIVTTIWEDLKGKYQELEEVSQWLSTDPRVTVIGEPEARPAELYEALFGTATGRLEPTADRPWMVLASFTLDSPPGDGTVGATGDEEQALSYLRETDIVLLCLPDGESPSPTARALFDHISRLRRIYSVVQMSPASPTSPTADDGTPRAASPASADEAWRARELELRRAFANQQLVCHRNDRLRADDLVKLTRSLHDRLDSKLRLKFISLLRHEVSRDRLVNEMIHGMSRTAAFLGVNPIPYADAVAILPVQILLVCRVAAAYGVKITVRDRTAFGQVAALVGLSGVGFRELYRAIKRRLRDPELPLQMALGAAVAWVGTELIGHAARLHYGSHGTIPPAAARQQATRVVVEGSLLGSLLG